MSLKNYLKPFLPIVEHELEQMIEELFISVAKQKQLIHFDLHGTITKNSVGGADLKIYIGKELLYEDNAAILADTIVKKQLDNLPTMIKDNILQMLDGQSVENIILEAVKGASVLVGYEKGNLVFYKITATSSEQISLKNFLIEGIETL